LEFNMVDSTTEQDRAVTTEQAAELLGCSTLTIKRALAADLPSFKLGVGEGRARRIWLADLKQWTRQRADREAAQREARKASREANAAVA
jgi:excisionase family DNA binding protein